MAGSDMRQNGEVSMLFPAKIQPATGGPPNISCSEDTKSPNTHLTVKLQIISKVAVHSTVLIIVVKFTENFESWMCVFETESPCLQKKILV